MKTDAVLSAGSMLCVRLMGNDDLWFAHRVILVEGVQMLRDAASARSVLYAIKLTHYCARTISPRHRYYSLSKFGPRATEVSPYEWPRDTSAIAVKCKQIAGAVRGNK